MIMIFNSNKKIKLFKILMVFALAIPFFFFSCSSDDSDGDSGNRIPAILSFSPMNGEPGDEITVTGTDLANATRVSFNGIAGSITSNTGTSLVTTVPEGATTGKISIETAGGTAVSGDSFEVIIIGAPVVNSIAPRSAEAGQNVTLTGSDMATVSEVSVGGVSGTIVSTSDTEVVFTLGDSPLGLSPIQVTSNGGSSTTNVETNVFYVIELLKSFSDTFDGDETLFSSGGDAEIDFFGINDTLLSGAMLVPNGVDNKFYYIGGESDTSDSGSYTGQIGHSQQIRGFFADYFDEDSRDLTKIFFNIDINFQGIPDAYDDILGGLRMRFDEGYDADGDGNPSDEYMEYRPTPSDLTAKGYTPNADGWYSLSISLDQFENSGASGGSWDIYKIEDLTRFAIASRRNHEGLYSLSIDNVFISKGGPINVPQ